MTSARYQDKVVMITGAAGGFGAEAAKRFAAEGAMLALSDIDEGAVAKLAEQLAGADGDIFTQALDVAQEDQMQDYVAACLTKFGRLDVAINNAGIAHEMAPITALNVETYEKIMAVNARSVFLGMKHQLPPMIEQGAGAILNVSSAAGLVGAGYLSAYAASKHAVVGLTKAAADEVARKGVRVNALCPSFADTPLFSEMADKFGESRGLDRDDAYQQISSRVPMQRVAQSGEIVQAMLWICDEENSFMTGQAISIDGGLTAI
ncbi:MAG: glucose 1-dehydrogenase [Hyphomicrobiales bacterium]